MNEVMTAEEFLTALKYERRNFQEIIVKEEVVIKKIFVRNDKPCINCKGAKIERLIIEDDIGELYLRETTVEWLGIAGKIGKLELQNATVDTLNLTNSEITWLYLSGITITDHFFFSELETYEINCGDNLELAWMLHLQGQKVVTNYKAVKSLFSLPSGKLESLDI